MPFAGWPVLAPGTARAKAVSVATSAARVARKASGAALQLAPSAQGMHIAHEVGERVDDTRLSRSAAEVGVYLAPLSLYCVEARRRGWVFGYAGFDEPTLRSAARAMAPFIRK